MLTHPLVYTVMSKPAIFSSPLMEKFNWLILAWLALSWRMANERHPERPSLELLVGWRQRSVREDPSSLFSHFFGFWGGAGHGELW